MEHIEEANEDLARMRRYLRRAPKRRATPAGCPRLELLLMLMFPNLRMDHSGEGLGCDAEKITNPLWFWLMKGAFLAVRRSGLAPLAWHKSRAG
eukprot:2969869-Lingulodinium_polyedra.AAC.1